MKRCPDCGFRTEEKICPLCGVKTKDAPQLQNMLHGDVHARAGEFCGVSDLRTARDTVHPAPRTNPTGKRDAFEKPEIPQGIKKFLGFAVIFILYALIQSCSLL